MYVQLQQIIVRATNSSVYIPKSITSTNVDAHI